MTKRELKKTLKDVREALYDINCNDLNGYLIDSMGVIQKSVDKLVAEVKLEDGDTKGIKPLWEEDEYDDD